MAAELENILRGTARSATYSVILQVSFRLITFIVNAIVLRYVSSELLGLVNVRLTLLYSTILFLSREAFRKACLSRTADSSRKKWRQLINLVWLCVPVGLFTSLILGLLWICLLEFPSSVYAANYPKAAFIFALSAVCELFVEPLWLIAQEFLFVHARVLIEATAIAAKCLSTILIIIYFPKAGLTGFCMAQIMHTICYVCLYYCYFLHYAAKQKNKTLTDKKNDMEIQEFPFTKLRDILPQLSSNEHSYIEPSYGKLVFSFLKQSLLKQFLTEGERYIMTIFSILSFGQQGVYDVINNLGSLVARFVFLPIEDSYYVLFCQMLIRGKNDKDQTTLDTAGRILFGVLKFVSLIGMIIVVFGFSYSYLALDIYGGKLLSSGEGPVLLRWYSLYVFIIAINGITECFMFALMSKDEVDRYNHRMVLFSLVFLAASLCFTKMFGSVGFIMANCMNMVLRIIHSSIFIQKYFINSSLNPLHGVFPTKMVSFSLIMSFVITAFSERAFCCDSGWLYRFIHIGIGGLCLLSVLLSILLADVELVSFLKEQWTGKISKAKNE